MENSRSEIDPQLQVLVRQSSQVVEMLKMFGLANERNYKIIMEFMDNFSMVEHYRWLTNTQISQLLDNEIEKTIEEFSDHLRYELAFQVIHSLILASDQYQ